MIHHPVVARNIQENLLFVYFRVKWNDSRTELLSQYDDLGQKIF